MTAFMVFTRERMRDEKEYEVYKQKNRIAMEGRAIKKDVLYGRHRVLGGPEVQGVVILEFPDFASAEAYYDSPAYREAREHRFKAADYRVLIVEGAPSGTGTASAGNTRSPALTGESRNP